MTRTEWRSIETAPRDVEVLVYDPDRPVTLSRFNSSSRGWLYVAYWSERDGVGRSRPEGYWMSNADDDDYLHGEPTHWMPLPEPPK